MILNKNEGQNTKQRLPTTSTRENMSQDSCLLAEKLILSPCQLFDSHAKTILWSLWTWFFVRRLGETDLNLSVLKSDFFCITSSNTQTISPHWSSRRRCVSTTHDFEEWTANLSVQQNHCDYKLEQQRIDEYFLILRTSSSSNHYADHFCRTENTQIANRSSLQHMVTEKKWLKKRKRRKLWCPPSEHSLRLL